MVNANEKYSYYYKIERLFTKFNVVSEVTQNEWLLSPQTFFLITFYRTTIIKVSNNQCES